MCIWPKVPDLAQTSLSQSKLLVPTPPTLWRSIPKLRYRYRATPTVRGVGRTARVNWSFSRRPSYFSDICARYQSHGRAGRHLRCRRAVRPSCPSAVNSRPTGAPGPDGEVSCQENVTDIGTFRESLARRVVRKAAPLAATYLTAFKKRGPNGLLKTISGRQVIDRFRAQIGDCGHYNFHGSRRRESIESILSTVTSSLREIESQRSEFSTLFPPFLAHLCYNSLEVSILALWKSKN